MLNDDLRTQFSDALGNATMPVMMIQVVSMIVAKYADNERTKSAAAILTDSAKAFSNAADRLKELLGTIDLPDTKEK